MEYGAGQSTYIEVGVLEPNLDDAVERLAHHHVFIVECVTGERRVIGGLHQRTLGRRLEGLGGECMCEADGGEEHSSGGHEPESRGGHGGIPTLDFFRGNQDGGLNGRCPG